MIYVYIKKGYKKPFLGHSTLPTINFALWDVHDVRRLSVVCVLPSTRELVQYRNKTIQASGDKP